MRAAIALVICLAGPLAGPAVAERLRIGASPTYPPYLFMDGSGQPIGIDAQLAHEICDRGGYRCVWVDTPVPSLIPDLVAGKIDLVMGGIGYSVARDRLIDFTCPYHVTADAFGTLFSRDPAADLSTARIAVTSETLHEQAMVAEGRITIAYPGNVEAVGAAISGAVEAYFGSPEVVAAHPDGAALTNRGNVPIPTTGAAIAVSDDRPDLRREIDALLAQISADGTLAELQILWLDENQGDVIAECDRPEANLS